MSTQKEQRTAEPEPVGNRTTEDRLCPLPEGKGALPGRINRTSLDWDRVVSPTAVVKSMMKLQGGCFGALRLFDRPKSSVRTEALKSVQDWSWTVLSIV